MSETRRVLVTGGAGFVGATLVRRLVAGGHSVRVLDNYSTGDPSYLASVDAELIEGDIRDAAALDAALAGIDAVVHLAAAGSVVKSVADPETNFDVNVTGTFRVLDAARRAGVERVVQASTGGALIGDATPPVTDLPLWRQQARRRRLRARLREVVRDAHGGAAVRERVRPLERAQAGGDDGVLPGHPHRRADRDLRRWLVVARLHPRRRHLPGAGAGPGA